MSRQRILTCTLPFTRSVEVERVKIEKLAGDYRQTMTHIKSEVRQDVARAEGRRGIPSAERERRMKGLVPMTALSSAAAQAGGFVPSDLARGQNQDPGVTPAQGRVVFHQERLFRSTGGGQRAHAKYLELCAQHQLPVRISEFTRLQCVIALRLIERACEHARLDRFRDCRTDWEQIASQNPH